MESAALSAVDSALVVDDEPAAAAEIRDRLVRLRVRTVMIESDGEDALDHARRSRPDIVLMSSELHGRIDGIEAADTFQRVLDVPVVLMTSRADPRSIARAKACTPRGWLPRPFREGDLAMVVEIALQRHALESQHKQRELGFAAALASVGDGVIATGAGGRITFMNAIAEVLTGWRSEDAIGQPADTVFQVVEEQTRMPLSAFVGGKAFHGRLDTPLLLVTRGGELIPVDGRMASPSGLDGQGFGVILAFRDVRRHRLAENAARRAADQLKHGQRLQAIGQLTGGVAHDFNNLLTVINGYADELLESRAWDPRTLRIIQRIRQAGARSAALTSRLLTFSRSRDGSPAESDPHILIDEISDLLRRKLGEDVELVTRLKHGSGRVPVEPSQFEQIVMNLAINARDAMPQGGRLVIETSKVTFDEPTETAERIAPGDYILMRVTDTGFGMDQKIMEQIFEPFFTTKPEGKGTGLGLATAYGIVREAGGQILVYSHPGSGTVFKVYLPAIGEESSTAGESEPAAAVAQAIDGGTILLVEDDPDVCEFASEAIAQCGGIVMAAANGLEALELANDLPSLDLLVTDIVMPSLTGVELARRLRVTRPELRVIFVSGYPDDVPVGPGDTFLQKPFSGAQLAHAVRLALAAKATPGTRQSAPE
ncbi:MAG TPA: response regulator [Vicinamibacterales bacterium]|nr:response regulator [Vicinamibacterales bacterium]